MLSMVLVESRLVVPGDDAATFNNIMANELLFRIGVAQGLIMYPSVVILSLALYAILRTANRNLALLALLCRLGEAILGGLSVLGSLVALLLLNGEDYSAAFETEQLQALVGLFLDVGSAALPIVFVFLSLGSIVFCYLFFQTRYVPRVLAALGVFSYLLSLIWSFVSILLPDHASLMVFGAPAILFEVVFGFWLMIKGANIQPSRSGQRGRDTSPPARDTCDQADEGGTADADALVRPASTAHGGPWVEVEEETCKYRYGRLFRVIEAKLRFRRPDGRMSDLRTRVNFERGDAVGVLLYDSERDDVILVRQFRYPVYAGLDPEEREGDGARKAWLLEIVAGIVDEGGAVKEVAHRELLEEAGYRVEGELKPLTTIYPSPGGTSERIHLFLGEVDRHQRAARRGGIAAEGEYTQVEVLLVHEAMDMIDRGEIRDAKTLIALQYLARLEARSVNVGNLL